MSDQPISQELVSQLNALMRIFHGVADETNAIADIYAYATVLKEAGKGVELTFCQGAFPGFLGNYELLNILAANDARDP